MPFCAVCNTSISGRSWIGHLRSNAHKQNVLSEPYIDVDGIEVVASAFQRRIISYRIAAQHTNEHSIDVFLESIQDKVKFILDECLKKHICLKVNFELFSMFLLFKNNEHEIKSFITKNIPVYRNYNFDTLFSNVANVLRTKIDQFEERDSGWTFLSCLHLEINVNKYEPIRGSTYIELPEFIKKKKACLNIRNNDEYCFLWSVVAALYPVKVHQDRISSYIHFREVLNTENMSFPVTFSDVKIFEENNPNLSFIIFGLKNNRTIIGPLYKSESHLNTKTIHLLLLENKTTSHYCLIRNLSRLVRSQITKHNGRLYFCDTCLLFFKTLDEVENHTCNGIVTVLPEKGCVIKFKNFDRKQDIPFVVYADFETMLESVENESHSHGAHTRTTQKHIPVAFAYNVVCSFNPSYNRFVTYRGLDCVNNFISSLYRDTRNIHDVLSQNLPMIFNSDDAINFRNAVRCHICQGFLFGDKVRDHCHLSGQYRGAAHSLCNLQYKIPKFVPIFFHNLAGYDCHLFIKTLGEAPGPIKIIPKTKENYISFTKFIPISRDEFIQLRFVDSFKFLGTSLEKLAKTMKIHEFNHLRNVFPSTKEFALLTRKGVYPYEYMNAWERYSEPCLPSKEHFYSSLNDEHISNGDYEHARAVWTQFDIRDLGQYTDLYLKTDVLLLTDIFENFRKTCKHYYHLDPAFYVTAPSLSFDAMLFKTGIQLELIDDFAIVDVLQRGVRGGIVMAVHRHAKANNEFILDYDPLLADSYIAYIDCNNLYGYSMCQSLPLSDFRFLDEIEVDQLDVNNVLDDADYGFILEVDLIYPKHLHWKHNDLPFCAEKDIPPGGKNEKLIPNLYDKFNYIIHYVHLKTCLKHGLILRKVHRVITFRQSAYLKQYIDLNTSLRQQATSTFEQDFFKLLNNSVFGKTLENNRKKVRVELVNQWSDQNNRTKKRNNAEKLIASPNFHSASVFTDNLVAIQLKPDRIVLDKPLYIGFTVLELSKSHMYDFHYSVFKPFYGDRLKMCYTDTDSFIYHIETQNFYEDLKLNFLKYFDTSNLSVNNNYGLPIMNKKVPGLFKDEMGGKIITEFVGLRSKLYCIKNTETEIKKAKGVKSCVVRDLNIDDYKNTLLTADVLRKKNILFKSIKHEVFTRAVNKIALSSSDDKRFISQGDTSTRAWGHISILGI